MPSIAREAWSTAVGTRGSRARNQRVRYHRTQNLLPGGRDRAAQVSCASPDEGDA